MLGFRTTIDVDTKETLVTMCQDLSSELILFEVLHCNIDYLCSHACMYEKTYMHAAYLVKASYLEVNFAMVAHFIRIDSFICS